MRKLDVRFSRSSSDSTKVGALAEDSGRVYFEYDQTFLANGLNLSPFHLPFDGGLFEHTAHDFGPLPGLFDDSLPDGWGLILMDRYFRSHRFTRGGDERVRASRTPASLRHGIINPLDRLAWLGTRTMGALTYHPPAEAENAVAENIDTGILDLHDLARQSQEILTGDAKDVLPQLLRIGGSPGGARPKVLVGFNSASNDIISGADDLPEDYEHWIVKFTTKVDSPDAGGMEYAYSLMARAAGIEMPPTRLFETATGDRFFGVKRFDRDQNRRFHIHTFGNLIQSNFRIPSMDYTDLLKATLLLTRNQQDVLRAFRRMVFNVMARNRDDHVKNFSFILDDVKNEWALSPAYDLLPTIGPGGEHTMTVAGEGRHPDRAHILRVAATSGISKKSAITVIDEGRSAIGKWKYFCKKAGIKAVPATLQDPFRRFTPPPS